jgi:predicted  nucleic acid-binding Zn-ribbon protein
MEVKKDLLGNDNGHNPEDKKDDQPPVDKVEEKTIEDLEDDIETIDDPVILKQKIKELKDLKAKLESNHQRGVQKILKDKREAETYIETFKKSVRAVRDDKSALVQIHKEHPKIAKEILEEYFD